MDILDWKFITSLSKPIDLTSLGLSFWITHEIKGQIAQLYAFSDHEFVLAGQRANKTGPLMGYRFYWSSSRDSVLTITQMRKGVDDFALLRPPSQLLVDGWRWSLGDILSACQTQSTLPFQVSNYPKGSKIYIGNREDFFRGKHVEADSDRAFAVAVDLLGLTWKKVD